MSDGKLGDPFPDGSYMFHFEDGFCVGWRMSQARANPMRFETPQAARLSWELTKKNVSLSEAALVEAIASIKEMCQDQSGVTSFMCEAP